MLQRIHAQQPALTSSPCTAPPLHIPTGLRGGYIITGLEGPVFQENGSPDFSMTKQICGKE